MAVDPFREEAVVGGSDHGVYVIDLPSAKLKRTLYTKTHGHSEWVTCVAYLDDGRIVSGAMDSKLCLWETAGARCTDLTGHVGSISDVATVGAALIVSAGYDKTVRLWGARGARRGELLATMKGHTGPVLKLALGSDNGAPRAVSAGRDGLACVWDLAASASLGTMSGHKGHVTAVTFLGEGHERILGGGGYDGGGDGDGDGEEDDDRDDEEAGRGAGRMGTGGSLFATGGQDGHVRVWDVRARASVANVAAHTSDAGSGAVGDLAFTACGDKGRHALGGGNVLVSAGADGALCVLDPRRGFAVRHRMTEHKDFVYSLEVAGTLCFSGGGDGMLITHDVSTGTPLWGLGANEAAVRCIGVTPNRLVASGDDGKALVYDF